MGNAVVEELKEYGCFANLTSITTDNASSNNTMCSQIEEIASDEFLNFTADNGHVFCIDHVLQLAVKAALASSSITAVDDPETDDESVESGDDDNVDEEFNMVTERADHAKQHLAIRNIRRCCNLIRQSTQRREQFRQHCHMHKVPDNMMIGDVSVRWHSTYDMLTLALKAKPAIDSIMSSNQDLRNKKCNPTADQWAYIDALLHVLKPFKIAMQALAGEKYVTMSLVIPQLSMLLDKMDILSSNKGADKFACVAASAQAAHQVLEDYRNRKFSRSLYVFPRGKWRLSFHMRYVTRRLTSISQFWILASRNDAFPHFSHCRK